RARRSSATPPAARFPRDRPRCGHLAAGGASCRVCAPVEERGPMTSRHTLMSLVVAGAGVLASCAEVELGAEPEVGEMQTAVTSPPLVPPAPFVLAADGVTKRSLEDADVYLPGGKRWAIVLGKALF